MSEEQIAQLEQIGFSLSFKCDDAEVWVRESDKIIVCILTSEYVPIEDFRLIFQKIGALVVTYQITKFIFDKRSLRTFHQPSMEWYYMDWKTEMLAHGLKHHRKILPNLQWFVKAVEVAKIPLFEKMPQTLIDSLDIKYCTSISEATEV